MSAVRIVFSNTPEPKRPIDPSKIIFDLEFFNVLKRHSNIGNYFTVEELAKGIKTLIRTPNENNKTITALDPNREVKNACSPIKCNKIYEAILNIAMTTGEFNGDQTIRRLIASGQCHRAEMVLDKINPKPSAQAAFEYLQNAIHQNPSATLIKKLLNLCEWPLAHVIDKPFIAHVVEYVENSQTILIIIDELISRGMEYPLADITSDPIGIAAILGKSTVLQHMKENGFWCQNTKKEYLEIFNHILSTTRINDKDLASIVDVFLSTKLVSTPEKNQMQAIQANCAQLNQHETSAMLLKYAGLLNQYTNGHTPLHQAVIDENLQRTRALLQAGANIHLPSKGHAGKTALHFAYRLHNRNMVELLLQFGADANKTDGKNRPPNHWLRETTASRQ